MFVSSGSWLLGKGPIMGSLPHRNAAIAVAIISAVWVTAASATLGALLLGVGGLVAFGAVGLVAGVLYAFAIGLSRAYVRRGPVGIVAFIVDHTWSLPNTVVGALWLGVNFLVGNRLDPVFNTTYSHVGLDRGLISVGTKSFWTTIGPVQAGTNWVREPAEDTPAARATEAELRHHESLHVLQARLFGPFYIPLVLLNYALATIAPYWLLYHDRVKTPINSLRSYFMDGVYPHVWNEEWAYRVAGPHSH